MLRQLFARSAVTTLVVGAVLAVAQLSGAGSLTAPSDLQAVDYQAGPVTTTEMWLDHPTMRAGQANAAHVKVSSNVGTPQGTVTFRVGTHQKSVALVKGTASYAIPTDLRPGTYRVSARYNGRIYRPSSDTEYLTVTNSDGTVAGTEGNAGNGAGRPGPGVEEAGLPGTGADENAIMFTLIGLGLLALGGFSLIGHRRRIHG